MGWAGDMPLLQDMQSIPRHVTDCRACGCLQALLVSSTHAIACDNCIECNTCFWLHDMSLAVWQTATKHYLHGRSQPETSTNSHYQKQPPAATTRYSHTQPQPETATDSHNQTQPQTATTRNSHKQQQPETATNSHSQKQSQTVTTRNSHQ